MSDNIKFAPQEKVGANEIEPFIQKILKVMGYEGAQVTDIASPYDFCMFSDTIERRCVANIRRQLGLSVNIKDTFFSIAERLREASRK